MKMKLTKIITILGILGTISSPLMATEWNARTSYGISGNKLEYNTNQDYNWGFQTEFTKVRSFESAPGLRLGWGIGFDFYTLGEVQALTDDAGYNVDGMFLAGYSLQDKLEVPIDLMMGLGYGVGQVGANYNHGLVYKVSANYSFTEYFAMGMQFKHIDMTVVTVGGDSDSGVDIVSAFISLKI